MNVPNTRDVVPPSVFLVPITRQAVMTLIVATLVPLAPLLLTAIPAEELARRLLKLVM